MPRNTINKSFRRKKGRRKEGVPQKMGNGRNLDPEQKKGGQKAEDVWKMKGCWFRVIKVTP